MGSPDKERTVNVPGQRFRHSHICKKCGNVWTHKAPTPMTAAVNDAIHTCNRCGAMRYEIDVISVVQDPKTFYLITGVLLLCLLLDHSA